MAMSSQTTNIGLGKWESADILQTADVNGNMDIIDTEIAAIDANLTEISDSINGFRTMGFLKESGSTISTFSGLDADGFLELDIVFGSKSEYSPMYIEVNGSTRTTYQASFTTGGAVTISIKAVRCIDNMIRFNIEYRTATNTTSTTYNGQTSFSFTASKIDSISIYSNTTTGTAISLGQHVAYARMMPSLL